MKHRLTKALLIEHDPADAAAIVKLLTETTKGFYIDCVDSVSTALSRLSLGDIDVVLLDLMSPSGEGLHRFASLRAQRPDLPIIVLVDRDNETLAMHAIRDGAKGHLLKEFTNGLELARRLENVTEHLAVSC